MKPAAQKSNVATFSASGALPPLAPRVQKAPAATATAPAPKQRVIPSRPDGTTIEDLVAGVSIGDKKPPPDEGEQQPSPPPVPSAKLSDGKASVSPAGVSEKEESSLSVFLDVLDEADLGILLASNQPGAEIIKKANRFFALAVRKEKYAPPNSTGKSNVDSVLCGCDYVTTEWLDVKFEISDRELFLAGPWGTPVKSPFASTDQTQVYVIQMELDKLESTVPARFDGNDYVTSLGCTSMEHSTLMSYKANFSGHAAANKSAQLTERCPGRRLFFRELTPLEKNKEGVPKAEAFICGGYTKASNLFCTAEELAYGVATNLENGALYAYLPENHALADHIKHNASKLGLQAIRIFASMNAELHPYNVIVSPQQNGKQVDPNMLCRPGNYLRLPKTIFDLAVQGYMAQRCYQETGDRLIPIERLCDVGFFLGTMGELYFTEEGTAAPEDHRSKIAVPAYLNLSDQKRTFSFKCRFTYAKKKAPMVVDPQYSSGGAPASFFTVGISQGVYPGDDNKLPIKDMAIPRYLDFPSLYAESTTAAAAATTTEEQEPEKVKVAFLTVPRNRIRDYLETRTGERKAIKRKPAYAIILAAQLLVQKLNEKDL